MAREHREVEGDNRQRREAAKEARAQGKTASEVGATLGASKQRSESRESSSHQERVDHKRQGKQQPTAQKTSEARPGSRDEDTADRERYPRMDDSDHTNIDRGTRRSTRGKGASGGGDG